MRWAFRCVYHDALRLGAFAGQSGKNPVEHAEWPILQRRILPLQTIADHIDDTTDDTLVINPRNPCDSGNAEICEPFGARLAVTNHHQNPFNGDSESHLKRN